MASKRRSSETLQSLRASALAAAAADDDVVGASVHRRSNSWTLSEYSEYLSDEDENEQRCLAERLTNQRWHEVGSGPHPICASGDFGLIVDQLSSILAMRLRDLLIFRMGASAKDKKEAMALSVSYLRLDSLLGDYVLDDSILKSVRDYVTCIGRLYNNVGFHSFEHAAHVTISMNKLLFMVTDNRHCSETARERRTRRGGEPPPDHTFGIERDPRVLFAMVFSALIHDVGHTGVPNSVLVDEEDELAILHNDASVGEQNSLQVAFSTLQREEFAQLKRCICPTPEERKFFRKKVITTVMVTDISDQERIQIVASRWNAAFPKNYEDGEQSAANGGGGGGGGRGGDPPPHRQLSASVSRNPLNFPSHQQRPSFPRRRVTMFATHAAAAKELRGRRLGIRTSMDFSGMLLDAYPTTDQLQQHAVLETLMNVADVAHTMQSFPIFCKWNRRLFKEFYAARLRERLAFDPQENWYENQIGFFNHYIIPLSKKMKTCGVFGTTGTVFEYFAIENRKRWIEEGEMISVQIIDEVTEEVEREHRLAIDILPNGCH